MLYERFLTAIVLLGVFVAALFFLPRAYWIAFLVPGLILASVEWSRLAGYSRGAGVFFAAATLLSFLLLQGVAQNGGGGAEGRISLSSSWVYALGAGFWVFVAPVWLVTAWRTRQPLLLGVTGWLVLVPLWIALVELHANPLQLLYLMAVVWIADTAAYLVGRRVGRRRLAPAISPGKTWEGVAGSVAAVAVYYALAHAAGIPGGDAWQGAGGLLVVAVIVGMSVEGDLFESWMKRQAGVKDSGGILPGHGGVLDRIDGLTASIPTAAVLLGIPPGTTFG